MFNQVIDEAKRPVLRYFGLKKISDWGIAERYDEETKEIVKDEKCNVWVKYEDGSRESMTGAEWKMASGVILEEKNAAQFEIDRLNKSAVPAVLDAIQKTNIRMDDINAIMEQVKRSLDTYLGVASEHTYGSDRLYDWKIGKVKQVADDAGLPYKKMGNNPLGEKLWDLAMADPETKMEDVYRAFIYLNNSWSQLVQHSKALVVGTTADTARISDLMQTIREREQAQTEVKKPNEEVSTTDQNQQDGGEKSVDSEKPVDGGQENVPVKNESAGSETGNA